MRLKLPSWTTLALLAALSTSAASSQARKQASPPQHVQIKSFQFLPPDLTVKAGTPVEWKNDDIVPHTVTADDGTFRSGKIQPGRTWTYTPTKPGTFPYTCTPHPNMHGKLTVQ
jgi:plastocyanin